jgi:16S rRNA A1518/A1519 N6-dimethyltransferase RsmA/KsgA/DIM1 with predicted DNA glycosylase/AP lyase activity
MKPDLDQHFMIDTSLLNKIVRYLNLNIDDKVLEIGGGKGALTRLICDKCKLTVVEIDKDMKRYLENLHCKVVYADAIKYIKDHAHFDKITGNIPYVISEPLLNQLKKTRFKLAIFTVGIRFGEKISTKKECKLSLTAPIFFKIKVLDYVEKDAFSPKPKTRSAIVKIEPKKRLGKKEQLFKDFLLQDDKLAKNALREVLTSIGYTKTKAKELIMKNNLDFCINTKNLSYTQLKKIKEFIFSF